MNIQGGRTRGKWEELVGDANLGHKNMTCITEIHLKEDEEIPDQKGWKWDAVNRSKGKRKVEE